MALPKIFDYDPASDETIVTAGVQGAKVAWFGFSVDRRMMHIVYQEGPLTADGKDLEVVVRDGQENIEAQDALDFYQTNNIAFDSLLSAVMETLAARLNKTGSIVT